mmetsp:Transcript_27875/g.72980  ORF Transcript_27875/g.72980 Transcript_27875/m.72980 type:complete len:279 (+) Transcript_27875:332-1168(+)
MKASASAGQPPSTQPPASLHTWSQLAFSGPSIHAPGGTSTSCSPSERPLRECLFSCGSSASAVPDFFGEWGVARLLFDLPAAGRDVGRRLVGVVVVVLGLCVVVLVAVVVGGGWMPVWPVQSYSLGWMHPSTRALEPEGQLTEPRLPGQHWSPAQVAQSPSGQQLTSSPIWHCGGAGPCSGGGGSGWPSAAGSSWPSAAAASCSSSGSGKTTLFFALAARFASPLQQARKVPFAVGQQFPIIRLQPGEAPQARSLNPTVTSDTGRRSSCTAYVDPSGG